MQTERRNTSSWSWFSCIFTARKRSLRRLCFYRCLFVHVGVLSSRRPPGNKAAPQQGHPPGRETPPAGRPPGRETPLGRRHPPSRETPRDPPAVRPPWETPPGTTPQEGNPPPPMATAAGSTHPTRMHSCRVLGVHIRSLTCL